MNTETKTENRGRPAKNITFIKGRPFTAKELVVRSRNIKRPVTLPTVLKHIREAQAQGLLTVAGKRETGKQGRPSIRYQLVTVAAQ